MQLKRIELEGFKSFADRTVIQIERGLTGIVGPNGCGKSNVVDALLWVMGERSAKTLRADEMLDVVFKGASGRGEAPYAMVEIILSDEEGQVAEAGAEVAVGRRLFRTGESEYLLNGRKSKRKEVRDLLMDTGLGVRSYMVLAQGKIDAVLSQNPAERRSVFEEAAGISRYKARKHEAELKLARVRQDLERVEDVHAEVQRSVRSLKYQASKAERYIQARDGHREAKIRLAWVESARFREEEAQFLKSTDELERAVQVLRTRREEADARLKSLEEEADTLRERHDHLRQEAATSRQEAATLEERVRGWDQQASDLEARHEREHERLSGLSDEDEGRQELSQTLADEQQTLTQARTEVQTALEAAELGFEAARNAHREVRDTMETLRAGVLESLADRTRFNNEAAVAAQTRSEAQGLLNSLKRRAGERGDEVAALSLKLNEATTQRTQAVAAFEALESQVSDLAGKVDACTRLEDSHRDAASASSAQAEEAKARLQALDAVEADQQGLPEDVRQKLEAENAQVSLMLDGVDVPAPWDRLLENLLGRMQHALWLEQEGSLETLEASVDCFYPVQGNFVPMEIAGARSLSSLLKGDVQRCSALVTRLGNLYCVATGQEARSLAKQHDRAMFLSEDGQLHGAGYARLGMLADGGEGVLARRNARQQAEIVFAQATREAEKRFALEAEAKTRLTALRAQVAEADRGLREAVAERDRCEARHVDLSNRQRALSEEVVAMESDQAQAMSTLESANREEAQALEKRDHAEAQRQAKNAELEKAEASSTERESALDVERQTLQEARLEGERHEQRMSHVDERIQAHVKLQQRDQTEAARITEELATLSARIVEVKGLADEGRETLRTLLHERTKMDERVEEASVQSTRAATGLATERAGVDGGSGRYEQLLENRQAVALDLQRVQLAREEQVRALLEEFQQPLEDLGQGLGLSAEDGTLDDEGFRALAQEVANFKLELDRIGHVNLEAVEELQEREEREQFLAKERADLDAGKANLLETIEDLDSRCRERFVEIFASVQGQFEVIFRRLFRGGKAELVLEQDVDPLIAGIEISARPPGKDLKSLKLLSGGEKTLTALALLLAVFRSKPSPFCLLDEVDAALDDANVGRFLDVLEDFVGETQFMVVTHNKITMGRCQRLFGVTMRKAGVSMVVAVDLSEIEANSEGEVAAIGNERGVLPQSAPQDDRVSGSAPEKEMSADGS